MAKLEVYLNEYNVLMDNTTYFPLASGQLRAYAETVPEVREYYEFMPFIFIRDDPDRVLSQYRNPAVAGFSCSMWNINLSLAVAQRVKERFPKCLIVFGGPSVPLDPTDFFIRHPFVDITVRGEGEHTFVELLTRMIKVDKSMGPVLGISYHDRDAYVKNADRPLEESLDTFPSPYLQGLYDYLLPSGINWQAIVETNRGCPFKCIAENELVLMADGKTKPISQVEIGEWVISVDIYGREQLSCVTASKQTSPNRDIIEVGIRDGYKLKCTPDHLLLSTGGWVRAENLKVGDLVAYTEVPRCSSPKVTKEQPNAPTRDKRAESAISTGKYRFHPKATQQDEAKQSYGKSRGQKKGKPDDERETQPATFAPDEAILGRGEDNYSRTLYRPENEKQLADESSQSNEGPCYSTEGSNSNKMETLFQSPELSEEVAAETNRPQQNGGTTRDTLGVPRFQVCRGRQILDWALPEWEVPKPRFHLEKRSKQDRTALPLGVLAPVTGKRCRGVSRLRENELENICYNRGNAGRFNIGSQQGSRVVSFSKVTSIRDAGRSAVYDIKAFPYHDFIASGIVVHNCSYCFWGVGKRYRFFSLNRVRELADWCGANRIRYVFCADSNFGMLKRDLEIAKYFVGAKAKYGYPEKVRACYGKNAEQTIFQIGKLLHEQDMEKGITLSRQSNDPQTLKNVGRRNIKQPIYNNLQRRYNDEGIPTYTELILGLPGETYQSFLSGMEEILQTGIRNQLMVYVCEVYPNTKLASKEYQERFAISTVRIPLTEIHGSVRSADVPTEYNEIVVSTATMSVEEWKRALVISWVMQLLHGLKLGYFILNYLVQHYQIKYTDFFEYITKHPTGKILGKTVFRLHILAELISRGFPRGVVAREFGSIYWEPEEAAYLRICQEKDIFYEEIYKLCLEYLGARANKEELKEIIERQKAIVPDINDYKDKETFGRKVVIYGRKSGKMLK